MIKVGIFGDSYASHGDPEYMWPTVMSKLDNRITVTNHGRMGSSLWYTYEQLLEHADKYTHIVVMVTQWGRYKLPNIDSPRCHVPGLRYLESHLAQTYLTVSQRKAYTSLYDWMLYCRNDEQERFYHQMTIDHIYRTYNKRCKLLMIPNFGEAASGIVPGCLQSNNMISISYRDSELPGYSDELIYDDPRPCHMNRANNVRFAHLVLGWVYGSPIEIHPEDYTVGEPWEIQIAR